VEVKLVEFLEKNSLALNGAIVALFLAVLFFSFSFEMADDLGFDFAGYAQRYNFAFSGWVKNVLGGVPADTFYPQVPSILPIALKAIGLGDFTLPVALSILVFRLLLAASFVLVAQHFKVSKKTGLLIGLLFVLNPVIYNFLDRYYELASWTFFVVFFVSFYGLLKEKKFSNKLFLLSGIFAALSVLSSQTALFFITISTLFLMTSKEDIKRLFLTGIFAAGLCAFWLLPFLYYLGLSVVSQTQGSLLQTPGIFYSSVFAIALLGITAFLFWKRKTAQKRILQLSTLAFFLALIELLAPHLPLINKPFIHSYHVFFFFVLAFCWLSIIKEIRVNTKIVFGAFAVFTIILIVGHAKIIGQYVSPIPTFSTYMVDEKPLDFSDPDYFLKKIPIDAKYEVFPYDPVVSSYSSVHYGLTNLLGWGFNAVALKNGIDPDLKFSPENTNCRDIEDLEKDFGLSHVISLNEKAQAKLSECQWNKAEQKGQVALFTSPNYDGKSLLVENGELLEYGNNYVKVLARPPQTILKINYFPLWKAYAEGKEIQITDKTPGMQVSVEKETTVEFKFENSLLENFSVAITFFTFILGGFLAIRRLP